MLWVELPYFRKVLGDLSFVLDLKKRLEVVLAFRI
jgi:hypothetical protein